jgi:beta-aspartyl-peptidase (threonine type)
MPDPTWSMAVHGGSGGMRRGVLSAGADAGARAGLAAALEAGGAILRSGGSALDAVEAAVRVLEDDPHFNAGRGAALSREGCAELDAAIMCGRTRAAGAVARVTTSRSPVVLARAVMERSAHVFLAGIGADAFSRAIGVEQVPNDWFVTDTRRAQLAELLAKGGDGFDVEMKYGTVGAVARDAAGHVAAATSTGGGDGEALGADRRFAGDRRRNLGRRPQLRRVLHRRGRVLPAGRRSA